MADFYKMGSEVAKLIATEKRSKAYSLADYQIVVADNDKAQQFYKGLKAGLELLVIEEDDEDD